MNPGSEPIILFDGVCNLCNRAVRLIIKADRRRLFRFGSLQSVQASELLSRYSLTPGVMNSVVLVTNGKVYTKSSAIIAIGGMLGGIYKIITLMRIVPRSLRDYIYDAIAANRYRWFGRRDECMIPAEKDKDRFIG